CASWPSVSKACKSRMCLALPPCAARSEIASPSRASPSTKDGHSLAIASSRRTIAPELSESASVIVSLPSEKLDVARADWRTHGDPAFFFEYGPSCATEKKPL